MRVLFAGTPDVAVGSLEALLDSQHEVVGVLTRPPAPAGRRRNLTPSPVHEAAGRHGLRVITSNRPHDAETMSELTALEPEVAAVVAYGALLREPALSALPHGWLNLHFSLLPAWRGAAPVQHAVMAGDSQTGVSVFQIERGLDTGPVFATRSHPIRPWHTAGDLLAELAELGAVTLAQTVDDLAAGAARAVPQRGEASLAPRLHSADAQVDWSATAEAIDRKIRGTTPAPGAWSTFEGRRIKLGPVRIAASSDAQHPGSVSVTGDDVLVGTGTAPVRLGELAPAGKGWLASRDWARGARLSGSSRFGETDA